MLNGKDFKYRYSTGRKDLPFDFFQMALSNSISFDMGLGYFSSASFNILSVGIAHFISNGGNMRLYINQYLTEEDYKLLQNNKKVDFEDYVLRSFYTLKKALSQRDEHFFKCLSYLVQTNRIEIKIVIPKDGGLAHEKFGIFTDQNNDKVAFTGSLNFTAAALVKNIETIECTCSWKNNDNKERIEISEQDFLEIWNGQNNNVLVFPAKKFCQEIVKTYPNVDSNELLIQEKEIIRKLSNNTTIVSEVIPNYQSIKEPHFPNKYPDGARPYQIQAYDSWVKNGKQGIFAMATGTGKTITSLNCALQEYQSDGVYQLLILVPTIALVEQWIDEIALFDFKNIITVFSENPQWRQQIAKLVDKVSRGKKVSFVIVSTYQSFTNKDFQQILPHLPDNLIIIADEAHNIGSESVRAIFRSLHIKRRIALSATPNRIYDEEGTAELEGFFNDKPPYVYNFPMSQAIEEGRLMEYCYYPKMVFLNDNEMQEYASITEQLMRLFDTSTGQFSDSQKAKKLLMLRKRILHKADDKMRVFKEIINDIGSDKLKYCFVYVPEGNKVFDSDDVLFSNTDIDSDQELYEESILKKMLDITKEVFPNTTCNTYTGNNSKTERKAILQGFENGQINVLFAMKCLDEGVDVPRAEYGIFASSTGNPRQFIQRRGRLLRKHKEKTFAHIYDMIVVPNFQSPYYAKDFWQMERSLVKGELTRVAYFANLATNNYTGALQSLDEVARFYDLVLSELILSINQ